MCQLRTQIDSENIALEDTYPMYQQYNQAQVEYQIEMRLKTESAIFRSKVKWYEESEQNSKYFYGLEKLIITIR